MARLTERQAAFARHLITGKSATEAARNAGYSDSYADRQATQLLEKPQVAAYLAELRAKIEDEDIADATEVLRFFTGVMRGTVTDVHIHKSRDGDDEWEAVPPGVSERRRAAEDLAKYHSLFIDRSEVTIKRDPRDMSLDELEEYLSDRGLLD